MRYTRLIMLELAILGLLKEHPMHGYDLRKRLRDGTSSGPLGSLSFGSLYPALARLERSGAVQEIDDAPALAGGGGDGAATARSASTADVIPLTGSLAGERAAFRARLAAKAATTARSAAGNRGRKVYEITALGQEMFESLLVADDARQDDDKGFALRWAFGRHLTGDARLRLLERRHRKLDDRLATAERHVRAPGRVLDRFERSIAEHTVETVAHELAWIDGLITIEHVERGDQADTTSRSVVS
jgi:DNA-binding PadR family transcriptional regulator